MSDNWIEKMLWDHEHILKDNGDKGLVSKMEIIWEWYLEHKGRNSVAAFIKDLLISGGIIAIIISQLLGG